LTTLALRLMVVLALTLSMELPAGAATKPILPHRASSSRSIRFLRSDVECHVSTASPTETNLDCDRRTSPNNEPNVIVDPTDPAHVVVSSNDYDDTGDQFYVTFDGGLTWTTGDLSLEDAGRFGSDPTTAIDPVSGNVIHASLNFLFGRHGSADGDIVVSISTDGGITWGKPIVVGQGSGADDSRRQVFHDKGWLATDTDPASPFFGRTYLVWGAFHARDGRLTRSPIVEAHSDDGGRTWTEPQEISGRSPLCTLQRSGPAGVCDEPEAASIAIGPEGVVWVSFLDPQNAAIREEGERFDDMAMAVRSFDGGLSWTDPVMVAALEDGGNDFPKNRLHAPTLTGLQLRVPSFGGIAVSPLTGEAFLTFTDNSLGAHDVAKPVTDAKVLITSSLDGSVWTPPTPVAEAPGDQWFPAVGVDPITGDVGVLFHQRDPDRPRRYDTFLGVGRPGSFALTQVNSVPSNPFDTVAFPSGVQACRWCTVFEGDYLGLDFGPDGTVNVAWTDMRRVVSRFGRDGHTENVFFSRL
jgi:hypothetical protein